MSKKTCRLMSVRCICPSGGADGVAKSVFAAVGGAIGAATTISAGAVTGGTLILATGLAVASGASAGVAAIKGLDSVFMGSDEIYIKMNGVKKCRERVIKSQEVLDWRPDPASWTVEFVDGKCFIEIMEYDWASADDSLGGIEFDENIRLGQEHYLIHHEESASLYEIWVEIAEA